MISLILGNLCSILALIADSVSASRKTARGVLAFQSIGQFCYGVGAVLLKGYTGAVQNLVSILRNFAAIRGNKNKLVEWGLIILGVGFSIWCNNLGLVGWLPILANLTYTLAVFRFQDDGRMLKMVSLVCIALFCIFNLSIQNYVGAISNIIVFSSTVFFLLRQKKLA